MVAPKGAINQTDDSTTIPRLLRAVMHSIAPRPASKGTKWREVIRRWYTGKPALLELFDALNDWFHSRVPDIDHFNGCFFINASAEFGDRDSAIHRACAEHKAGITALIRGHVEELSLPKEITEEITSLIVLLKEGAISMAHVEGNLDAALEAKGILANVLNSYTDQ